MRKNIMNKNDKGHLHGYQEWYHENGILKQRCVMKYSIRIGYVEWHFTSGFQTNYHIR